MACLELREMPSASEPKPEQVEATVVSTSSKSSSHDRVAAPPCFFSQVCLRRSTIEKAGRSVCRGCGDRMRGLEYPLRDPSLQPLYLTGRAISEDLDMVED